MISVIMSVYNENLHILKESIKSILEQTYSEFEFIIVNDNPDNLENIEYLSQMAKEDTRIKLILNEQNIGLANSLNRAIEYANGTYILRMDADDISYSTRIEEQLEMANKRGVDILGTYVDYIDDAGNNVAIGIKQPCSKAQIEKVLKYRNCVYHPTWIVRKSVYEHLEGYRNVLACEDYDFLLRASNKGFVIENMDKCLLHYRINVKSISHKFKYEQVVISQFLQDNAKVINDITTNDINEYIANINHRNWEKQKFFRADYYSNRAIEKKNENKKIGMFFYLLLSIVTSKYFLRLYVRILKSKIYFI